MGSAARCAVVGRCRLTTGRTRVDCAWFEHLKFRYDEPLSCFAFHFNLRPYAMGPAAAGQVGSALRRSDGLGVQLHRHELGQLGSGQGLPGNMFSAAPETT
jgi:hypothetical protein